LANILFLTKKFIIFLDIKITCFYVDTLMTLEYIPAPGSPSYNAPAAAADSDSEEDPLDAFMANIETQVGTQYKIKVQ
jgi:hypothetical protein